MFSLRHRAHRPRRKDRALIGTVTPPVIVRKEDAPCCAAQRDELGRLPIGYCSTTCVRRPRSSR